MLIHWSCVWVPLAFGTQVGSSMYGSTPATISGTWFGSPVSALSLLTPGVSGEPLPGVDVDVALMKPKDAES